MNDFFNVMQLATPFASTLVEVCMYSNGSIMFQSLGTVSTLEMNLEALACLFKVFVITSSSRVISIQGKYIHLGLI